MILGPSDGSGSGYGSREDADVRLYMMRHGPAEDQAVSGRDGDRALTASGRERVRRVGHVLAKADEAPLHVITSHLVRAVQTAEIVAVVTKLGDRGGSVDVRRELAPSGQAQHLARELVREGRKRVLLVGHEPDLTGLVAALVGRFGRPFEKAMVVGLELSAAEDSNGARIRFFLDPKTLELEMVPR
jgi:phosphohistidine phosphatase